MRRRVRRFYWRYIRHWETEICDCCGGPVRLVWWCHDDRLWERITGKKRTPGSREAAGGTWCILCFDRACREAGVGWLEWAPLNLRYLSLGMDDG